MKERLYKNKIFLLVVIVLIIKLLLLPFSQTTDADAVTRVFLSLDWLDNPSWIKTSVWAPLHFYLNGFGLYLWNNQVLMPKIINIVLGKNSSSSNYFYFTSL